jgi:hypothetical protein
MVIGVNKLTVCYRCPVELLTRRDQRANQTAHEQTKQACKPATKPPKRNSPQPTNTSTIAINALAKLLANNNSAIKYLSQ